MANECSTENDIGATSEWRLLFVAAYVVGFFLAAAWAVVLLRVDLEASWVRVNYGSSRLKLVLLISPAIAALLCKFWRTDNRNRGQIGTGPEGVTRECSALIFSTMVLFSVLALTVVGRTRTELWIAMVGRSFYTVYFGVCPIVGYAGAKLWVASMRTRRARSQ